jgi:hypothetical protein
MTNLSALQAAAVAVCDANASLSSGRAAMALAMSESLDLLLTASVGGKSFPFMLREYAFKPVTADGKTNGKLRNAQFAAIMSQAFGEPVEPRDVNAAVKTAFNETFPAALYIAANELNVSLDDGVLNSVPVAFAFDCFDKEGKLTDTGKAIAERVIAMFSPDSGPEMNEEAAIAEMFDRKVDNVGGTLNRRYGVKTATVTKVMQSLSWAAQRDGLIEAKQSRAPRNGEGDTAGEAIKAFDTFLAKVLGKDGEADIALDDNGVKALKALRSKLDTTIKAIA